MLKEGNYPGEAYMRSGQRKILYRTERDFLEGPMKKQRYSIRPLDEGKTWPSAKKHVEKRKECGRR